MDEVLIHQDKTIHQLRADLTIWQKISKYPHNLMDQILALLLYTFIMNKLLQNDLLFVSFYQYLNNEK